MRYLMTCLLLLGASSLGAMEAYRWVDQNGIVHYSDEPVPGAEKVQLNAAPKPGTVVPARPPPPRSEIQEFRYSSCVITSPAQDQVLLNADSATASIDVQPAIRPGDHIEVMLNGQMVAGWPGNSTSYLLKDLARGSYSLSAIIVDPDGRPACTASPVAFHVRQSSLLTPGRKPAPHS